MQHARRTGQNPELFCRLRGHFHDALDQTGTVLDADNIAMLSQEDDFWSFQCDASENRNGIEKDRNWRIVGKVLWWIRLAP